MGAKLPTAKPSGADKGSSMFGIEYDGDKAVQYRGYRQEIDPIVKSVDLMREIQDQPHNRFRQIKPVARIPKALIFEFAKERGVLPSQVLTNPDLRKQLHKRVLTDPDYKRLVI